jgi:hypothetical protein
MHDTIVVFSETPIHAAPLVALIQTPYRFRSKRQFWSYVGITLKTYPAHVLPQITQVVEVSDRVDANSAEERDVAGTINPSRPRRPAPHCDLSNLPSALFMRAAL